MRRNILLTLSLLCVTGFLYSSEDLNFEDTLKKAEQGDSDAMIHLAWCYQHGVGTEKEAHKAFEWFNKAAELGNANAAVHLARCYRDGVGTKKDFFKTFEYFQKAAELKDANARGNLAWCYQNGIGTKKSNDKAFEWYQKAAELGDANAELNLAYCYRDGIGTKKDLNKAFEYFSKAAEQGNTDAQYQMGLCYGKGSGVARDKIKACDFFYEAAEKDNTNAMLQIACYYFGADGFEIDPENAMTYVELAAEKGASNAQIKASMAYLSGICTLKNACDESYIIGSVPKNPDKVIQYAEAASKSSKKIDKTIGTLILLITYLQKGDWNELLKISMAESQVLRVYILIVLIAIILEAAIAFALYRRSPSPPDGKGIWRLSDIFFLILLFIPLMPATSILTLLPFNFFTTATLHMFVMQSICIIIFALVLRKRGANFSDAFALKKIPIRVFFFWFFGGASIIFMGDFVNGWAWHIFNSEPKTQLVSEVISNTVNQVSESQVPTFIMGAILIPIVEEFIFRGIIYQSLKTKMKTWIAIIVSALIFSAIHGSFSALLPIFIVGILLAYSLEKTKSLYVPISLHCLNNAIACLSIFQQHAS